MEKLIIRGGNNLHGAISIAAAKNSVLPIIACSILSREEIVIKNVPKISDIYSMLKIIKSIGGKAEFVGSDVVINCMNADSKLVSADLTSGIRSSIFILGPILSRFKFADISYPGGCEIGLRPIDLHISGLKSLNVSIDESNGMIFCDGTRLSGGVVNLDFPSVGATENLMMAGVLGAGKTIIRNAAREPEIVDLQNFINHLGGKVSGAGSSIIVVEGVEKLSGGEYRPIGDRIVAGTFLCACAAAGGEITLDGIAPSCMYAVLEKLRACGCEIVEGQNCIEIKSNGKLQAIQKIETQVYPGFPTDMQPQIVAVLSRADGSSVIVENLFENRFKYTVQLGRMGANILVKDRVAIVKGAKRLSSACVSAEDLRGGASLVIAALATSGVTTISNIYHIDRGYYKIEDDLRSLGADIKRVNILNK